MEGRGAVFDEAVRDLLQAQAQAQAQAEAKVPSVAMRTIPAEEYDRLVSEHKAALFKLDLANHRLRVMTEKVGELLTIEEAGGSNSNEKVRVLLALARMKEWALK